MPHLGKPEKVRNKSSKEKIRRGTKDANQAIVSPDVPSISRYFGKIVCGDAEKVLSAFPGESIDLIVTSPPYNFGHSYASDPLEDTREWNDYFRRLHAVWEQCYRVVKVGGRIAVNVQPLYSDYIPTHHIISRQLLELGFLWKAEFLWEKNNYNAKYTAWGSWQSPSMPYIKYTWEFIEVFDKGTHKKHGMREDIDITAEEFKAWVNGRWSFLPEIRMKEYRHPAMFPEELPRRLVKLFSYRGDSVLDPFNGAGTTTLVAAKLGRNFIGIDLSPDYCQVALARLQELGEGMAAAPSPEMLVWGER